MAENLNGIVINEVLAAPNGLNGPDPTGFSFDVDGNGLPEANDDFIELYNPTGNSVDISGWTLSDGDTTPTRGNMVPPNADPDFTFPSGTVIPAGGYVVVVRKWDGDDPLPPNYFETFQANERAGTGLWDNRGDEVILSNGTDTIVAIYNNGNNRDIPNGATVDDFGDDIDGQSLQRDPDDLDNVVSATPTPGAQNECFVTGTLIATARGEVAVEDLKVGDLVQTAAGQLERIKWIGRQTVKPADVRNPMRGYPILVKAGALGDNLPVRDLYVSPDHALLVDGLLINAGALVNSISILQTEPSNTFTYFHVELEKHSLLIAEGIYAESYLPQKEDRACYDNAEEYTELYPEGPSVMLWPMDYPRVSSYTTVPRYVRKRLQTVADQFHGAVTLQAV